MILMEDNKKVQDTIHLVHTKQHPDNKDKAKERW